MLKEQMKAPILSQYGVFKEQPQSQAHLIGKEPENFNPDKNLIC